MSKFNEEHVKAAMDFAMNVLKRMPNQDRAVFEANLTGTLIVLWGALWGSFGTEYARGFIEAQLRSMEGDADTFTPPRMQ